HSLAVGDGRVGRAAQVDGEVLVRLAKPVAVHQDGYDLAGLTGGKCQRPRGGPVVLLPRAVPSCVAKLTVTTASQTTDRPTVKVKSVVPVFPSGPVRASLCGEASTN